MSDLYREATEQERQASEAGNRHDIQRMWVVPVERCEHGNTGVHVIRDQKRTYHPSEVCPGVTDDE